MEGSKYFIETPKRTIITYFILIIALIGMFKLIPSGFLPTEDSGAVFTNVQMKDGTSLAKTTEMVSSYTDDLLKIPGVHSVLSMIGFQGQNTAILIAHLDNWKTRMKPKFMQSLFMSKKERDEQSHKSIDDIIQKANGLSVKYPNTTMYSFVPPAITGLSMFGGFEYQLLDKGERTPQELHNEAKQLILKANQDPKLTSVFTQYNSQTPQLMVNIDYQKILAQGIDINDVYTALSSQFGTYYVNDFNLY